MISDAETTATQEIAPSEPTCSTCGYPLHVQSGGLQPVQNEDGTLGIVNVAVLVCTNSNYNGTAQPCPMNGQEQQRKTDAINTFEGRFIA